MNAYVVACGLITLRELEGKEYFTLIKVNE